MQFLVNPTIAYALIVAGVTLFFLTNLMPKSRTLVIGMVICLIGAGYELVTLRGNPWALIIVGLSPIPFLAAVRQTRWLPHLLLVAMLMLTVGAMILMVDQNGRPTVSYGIAGVISIACGEIVWIAMGRTRNAEGLTSRDNPPPVVGMIGKVRTEIGVATPGLVEIDGELWTARSKEPIEPGSTVRVLRCDGPVLTVKKAEKLARE
jgi:membrane-bound serine protease (ClpP class)